MRFGIRSRWDSGLALFASASRHVDSGVALTFDDGPVPGTTDLVLDCLADLDVTATFFCVGRNAERHPALLNRILAEGHSVGSHSLTHAPRGTQSPRELLLDYREGRRAVEDAAGRPVTLFRPPYGRVSPRTLRSIRSCDTWTWSVDPGDWQEGADLAGLVAALRSVDEGDVVLLHDWLEPQVPHSRDRSPTIGAVKELVTSLRRRQISLVPLPTSR
jgi:chitooligosaccharide deacetylase